MTQFSDLGLNPQLLRALTAEGYTTPTPIQTRAIPELLQGHDLLGIAQTGTGKTAAFALPILQRLVDSGTQAPKRGCRALILSPTRELAVQIGESIRTYGRFLKLTSTVVVGGMSMERQVKALAHGVDILVATPGRLLDHVGGRTLTLNHAEIIVLDEADQMLDMGFVVPVRKIVAMLPKNRQSLFFSATMPREIGALAADFLTNPVRVEVTPVATTAERVEQQVIHVDGAQKRHLLTRMLAQDSGISRALVFARTKHGANKIAEHLVAAGIGADAIHGNKSQGQRQKALNAFKSGNCRVLVATDIAARGIDVDNVSHVINFDLPNVPESYVHRIGRTGRAAASGVAISFCAPDERSFLRAIEKLTRKTIAVSDRFGGMSSAPAGSADVASSDRPRNDRSRNDRPQNDRPRSERPKSERNWGERTPGDRNQDDRNGQPRAQRSQHSAKPAAPRPAQPNERPRHEPRAEQRHGDARRPNENPRQGDKRHPGGKRAEGRTGKIWDNRSGDVSPRRPARARG